MRFAIEMEQAENAESAQSDRAAELRRDPITNTWVLQMDGENPRFGRTAAHFARESRPRGYTPSTSSLGEIRTGRCGWYRILTQYIGLRATPDVIRREFTIGCET